MATGRLCHCCINNMWICNESWILLQRGYPVGYRFEACEKLVILSPSRSRSYGHQTWRPYFTHLRPHLQSFLDMHVAKVDLPSPPIPATQYFFQCCWLLHLLHDDFKLHRQLQQIFHELCADLESPTTKLLLGFSEPTQLRKTQGDSKVLEKVMVMRVRMLGIVGRVRRACMMC
jgi:hypothetical protein